MSTADSALPPTPVAAALIRLITMAITNYFLHRATLNRNLVELRGRVIESK